MLQLELDAEATLAAFDAAPRKTSLAILRGTKHGTKSAHTLAGRVVAKDMGLKVGDAKKAIRMTPPSAANPSGTLSADLKRIPLIKFGAKGPEPSRGKGRGVSYRSGSGRKRIREAFIATMPTGHRGVYERRGRRRLPIRELFGPSIGRVLDLHRAEIMERGAEVAINEINRQIGRILGARVSVTESGGES